MQAPNPLNIKFWSRRLIPVYLLTFVNTIGFSILIPVLPFVVEQYNEGAFVYGVLLSTYSLFQFLATPIIGSLSDKYGRRATLILSQAGTLASWVIFAAAYFTDPELKFFNTSLPIIIILISRIIDGITGGNISVTNAYVADITSSKERTKIYGYTGAIMGMAFMTGPVIGGYSASLSFGYLGTVIIAGFISLITLICIFAFLKESLPKEKRCKKIKIDILTEINLIKKIATLGNPKVVKPLFWREQFMAFGFSAFTSTFALYAKDTLYLDAKSLGLVLLMTGVFTIFNQTQLTHRVSKKLGNPRTFALGQLLLGLSIGSLFFQHSIASFMIVNYFITLGTAFSVPSFKTMLTSAVSPQKQGQILGVDEAIIAGHNGIAPLVAGSTYAIFSHLIFPFMGAVFLLPFILKEIFPILRINNKK